MGQSDLPFRGGGLGLRGRVTLLCWGGEGKARQVWLRSVLAAAISREEVGEGRQWCLEVLG